MIVFDLACDCGCHFEGWFRDHAEFATQKEQGQLLCPQCHGSQVAKILSPVALRRLPRESRAELAAPASPLPKGIDYDRIARQVISAASEYVEKNFEDVGPRLAQEALKMQSNKKEMRNIRGEATPEEEELLKKRGIELLKVVIFKKDDEPEH